MFLPDCKFSLTKIEVQNKRALIFLEYFSGLTCRTLTEDTIENNTVRGSDICSEEKRLSRCFPFMCREDRLGDVRLSVFGLHVKRLFSSKFSVK